MSKSRYYFRIVLGVYLAYIGFGLVKDSFVDKPENYLFFGFVGVLFLILGIAWAGYAIKGVANHEYEENDLEENEEEEETDTIETEAIEADDVEADKDSRNEE